METIIAACGLDCGSCPGYIAWKTDDRELRIKTAAEWKEAHGYEGGPEGVDCAGCMTAAEGPRIGYCAVCTFRSCATERRLSTCAACKEFPCGDLETFHAQVPSAKANLEALRA